MIMVNYDPVIAQSIRFSEVNASNSVFTDEDGETPDWLELHNFGTVDIELYNWNLTDDFEDPEKWKFPNVNISPGEYFLIWASGKDRKQPGVPKTLITKGDEFRYLIPNQEVNSSWTAISYNDSGWLTGISGFGYGDGDDATLIPQGTRSVYLRKKFTIGHVDKIEELLLDIDFDDAFVAYLNGVEIARSNINGTPPTYNSATLTDHEAKIYRDLSPDRFIIEDFESILIQGENILCIQAHNVSGNSSDFTIIPFLSAIFSEAVGEGIQPPELLNLERIELHTNFKISNSGESLYLLNKDISLIDSFHLEALPPDVSAGKSIGENDIVFYETPTPGHVNSSTIFEGVLPPNIQFSQAPGKTNSFSLELTGVSEQATIRYTLNASEPNGSSPIYSGPVPINSNHVVRARIFRPGYIKSLTQSNTYLVNVSHELPIMCLVTDPVHLFDNDSGIYVFGSNYESDFPHFGANFWEDWERPMHISFFEPDNSLGFSLNAGTKIFGGWSRGHAQKSFSIFARSKYGTGEIEYPIFPGLDYSKFESFVLRNSGNDWLNTMIRDAALTSLMQGTSLDYQASKPVVTYINGDYWGFYNLREKVNEHYLAQKYQLKTDDIDLLELNGQIIHGENSDFIALMDFVGSNNLSTQNNYQFVEQQVDIENYIIYLVAQIYFDNTDWPGNNLKYWRQKNGKWKWILFDTDFGFGIWNNTNYQNNTLGFALEPNGPNWPNPPWSTLLFRKLSQNIHFRNSFVNRFADELNSRFLALKVHAHIEFHVNQISSEIQKHYSRWSGNVNTWNSKIAGMKNFATQRPTRLKQHILSEFNLDSFHKINVQIDDAEKGFVQLNSLSIHAEAWSGDYFKGVPITMTALAYPGYQFSHWSGNINSTDDEIEFDPINPMVVKANFIESTDSIMNVVINEIKYDSDEMFNSGDWIELYNPNPSNYDLSNWVVKDSDNEHIFTIPAGTQMRPDGFLILARDINRFHFVYPNVLPVIGDFNFGLSSTEDMVRIYNAEEMIIDSVHYFASSPWPELDKDMGETIELKDPELNNSLPESWASINEHGSPGKPNQETSTTTIEDIGKIKFNYFPNPSKGDLNIIFSLDRKTRLKALVYTLDGTLVKSFFDQEFNAGVHHFHSDNNSFGTGLYIVRIFEGKIETGTFKWFKSNS